MHETKKSPVLDLGKTTRRSFVGGVGVVVLGCASDDGGSDDARQALAMGSPSGSDNAADSGAAGPVARGAGGQTTEPTGSGEQEPQPTNFQNEGTPADTASPAPNAATPGSCTLYPEQTEGPYYVDGDMLRADIREGKPGTLLTLDLLVLSANGCAPLANAAVDIWHCDAAGVYSGFEGQLGGLDTRGAVFLRGTQLTGPDGRVQFRTIYPGWYPGRTTHIHFKVHLAGNREVTSQLYFDEALNREVYATAAYATHGQKDTSNAADLFAGSAPLALVTRSGQGYVGSMTITVAS